MDCPFHFCRPSLKHARKTGFTKTTANVFSKVRSAVASAFRVNAPAMALA